MSPHNISHLLVRGLRQQDVPNVKMAWSTVFEVVVSKIHQVAERIRSFELRLPDGAPAPPYLAGSNITFLLPNGLLRTYSLTDEGSAPDALRIAVLDQRNGRGGSRFMHSEVKVGDKLAVRGIANTFCVSDEAKKHILIAGGIGITPILSLSRRLHSLSADFEIHYGAKSPAEAAFADELVNAPFGERVHLYFDDRDERIDLARLLANPCDGTAVYCCGPPGLMDAVSKICAHWPQGSLRLDSFEPNDTENSGIPFHVRIASTGQTVGVLPGQSILSVLRGCGVDVSSQCEQGVCGACLTPVIEGTPDHRDRVLSESERRANDLIAICCSRSLSNLLVLDI